LWHPKLVIQPPIWYINVKLFFGGGSMSSEEFELSSLNIKEKLIIEKSLSFKEGVKVGIPIAVGYIPIAVAFGLLAKSADIPNSISLLMSLVIFAGASQFVGVNLLALGIAPWEIVMTTFILNLRHFLMSASLSQRIEEGTSKKYLALLSFGITDETFSIASLRNEDKLSPGFILGLNLTAFSAWNAGTWIGVFLATGLPESIKTSMGIALYAMFIGLLVPSLKSRPVLTVSLLSIMFNLLLNYIPLFDNLSTGWCIIISTIISSIIGTILFPQGVKNNE
jgi:4-azaleucine resistance transporter AzlC